MKTLLTIAFLALLTSGLMAQGQTRWAGRVTGTNTSNGSGWTNVVFSNDKGVANTPILVDAIRIVFTPPLTGYFALDAVQSGMLTTLYSNNLTSVGSIIYNPQSVWLDKRTGDYMVIRTSPNSVVPVVKVDYKQ